VTVPGHGPFAMCALCMAPQLSYLVYLHLGVKDMGLLVVFALYISELIVCALNAGHIIILPFRTCKIPDCTYGVELCV
jgi:hypothetical protein